MPELPEVEAARRAIELHCNGKRIIRAIIAVDSKVIDGGLSSSDFENSITGKTIVSAHRKGKNLWLHLDSPPFPSFQFGQAFADPAISGGHGSSTVPSVKNNNELEQQEGENEEEVPMDHEIRSRKFKHVVIFNDTRKNGDTTNKDSNNPDQTDEVALIRYSQQSESGLYKFLYSFYMNHTRISSGSKSSQYGYIPISLLY